ncbi:hypothetical protein RFI_40092, partial [Reticulomyxa filosa]
AGLVPIVEIPYAKYLDCGADMFYESVIMNWLSNGNQPNGMLIRLQGFGTGLFGGNFHTHNSLNFPPGLDVVCYSNGSDYVRGWRYNIQQAKGGRVVMSVDCTKLLNQRHVFEDMGSRDSLLLLPHPTPSEYITLEDVILYPSKRSSHTQSVDEHFVEKVICSDVSVDNKTIVENHASYSSNADLRSYFNTSTNSKPYVCIVTYGVGVPLARQVLTLFLFIAQEVLCKKYGYENVLVIDTPCLSKIPNKLKQLFESVKNQKAGKSDPRFQIMFADMCKEMNAPLNNFA